LTEMEYNWAMECQIPVLIFCIDEDFRWSPGMVDGGEAGAKLRAFKGRVGDKHVLKKFSTVDSFRADLYPPLLPFRDAARGGRSPAGDSPRPSYKDRRTEELGEKLRRRKEQRKDSLIDRAGPEALDRILEEIRC